MERVSASWKEAAGEGLASLSRPLRFRDGELAVIVEHPAAAMEIRLRESEILRTLNGLLGAARIRRIVPAGHGRKKGS